MASKSTFEEQIRRKNLEAMPEDRKKTLRVSSLSQIIKEIDGKQNRYIFYCPDITMVNPLVKIVYEVAFQVQKAGYDVVMLHEMNGYKAKWLFESPDYEQYSKLKIQYAINSVSKKSRRTKNMYTFKTADTLVVTDAFQDMLENLSSERSLDLMQKIVLVTGYMGLASLNPGTDYNRLGVGSLIFFEDSVKADYEKLFQTSKNYMIDNFQVSKSFNRERVVPKNVGPVIAITSVGNNERAQQLINIFYNKYQALSMFTFKIVDRENLESFISSVATAAMLVILDKNIVTKQLVYEVMNMGTPMMLPKRREFSDNVVVADNFMVEDDPFYMAEQIATFATFWLEQPTTNMKESITVLADKLDLNKRNEEEFGATVADIFGELQATRRNKFEKILEAAQSDNV